MTWHGCDLNFALQMCSARSHHLHTKMFLPIFWQGLRVKTLPIVMDVETGLIAGTLQLNQNSLGISMPDSIGDGFLGDVQYLFAIFA